MASAETGTRIHLYVDISNILIGGNYGKNTDLNVENLVDIVSYSNRREFSRKVYVCLYTLKTV